MTAINALITRPKGQTEEFKHALEDCSLHDLGYKGPRFTWNNGWTGEENILERLDRVVANMEWSEVWRDAGVDVLTCCSSDHLPLLLSMSKLGTSVGKRSRPFWYQAGWSKCTNFKKVVQDSWATRSLSTDPWKVFRGKQQGCQRVITQWVQKQKPPTEKQILAKATEL